MPTFLKGGDPRTRSTGGLSGDDKRLSIVKTVECQFVVEIEVVVRVDFVIGRTLTESGAKRRNPVLPGLCRPYGLEPDSGAGGVGRNWVRNWVQVLNTNTQFRLH